MQLSKKIEKEFEDYINGCCKTEQITFTDIKTLQIALRDFKSILKRIRKEEEHFCRNHKDFQSICKECQEENKGVTE